MSCSHLDEFWSNKANIRRFNLIYAHFVKPSSKRSCLAKALHCFCSVCNEHSPRLHACLFCITFGCYDTGHIQDHANNEQHYLAIDVNHGQVFCFECSDYVYSTPIYEVSEMFKQAWHETLGEDLLYRPWNPQLADLELMDMHKDRIKRRDPTTGLRGLYNLGSTCFMNCTVQALIHTPFLRSFFLADMHTCSLGDNCLVCEMHCLFQAFFSGQEAPLSLHKMLHMIWTQASHMAGYKEQDAHEFFIATLDLLHRHCDAQPGELYTIQPFQCRCIIDLIFTGSLKSDVVCEACQNISTTVDPFWDISLDIGTEPHSLIDCLDRFTRPEDLDEIECSNCTSHQKATKQLTLKSLPLVACFHLKRLNVEPTQTYIRRKISTQIDFPAQLDMTPFLSHARNGTRDAVSKNNIYCLYAVTNHAGSIDSGHYTAFVKQAGQWYKCDDDLIMPVSLSDVLACEGYQLFYHKQDIKYEIEKA